MRGRGGWKIIFTVLVMCLFAGGSVYADGSDRELTGDVDASDSVLQEGAIPSLEDVSAVTGPVSRRSGDDGEASASSSAALFGAADPLDKNAVFAVLSNSAAKWNGESSIKVSVAGLGVTPDNVKAVYTSFINTHGEFFFLSSQFSYGWKESAPNKVTSITMKSLPNMNTSMKAAFNSKVNEIVSLIDPSWTDVEKVLYIHDYLDTHCGYDEGSESTYHYDAYSCLIGNSCVCQGYSLTFDYLARLAGVDSYLITSKQLSHAWNMVIADGKYYYIDCTYDDPMKNGKDLYPGYCGHDYFLISHSKMKNNKHYSNDWLIDSFDSDPGYGTDTKYDSGAFWSGTIARIIPVSSHKWCFLDKGSTTLKYYNFNSGSKGNFAVIPESFSNASLTYDGKGGIFVSTAKKIYRISSDGSASLLFTYTKSDGSIYGIDVSGPYLFYYIYKNDYTYISQNKLTLSDHWEKRGGKWYYVDENDICCTGFNKIGGVMYFFDDDGAMVTGWKSIEGAWYFFESSGAMKTGWFKSGSTWYYMDDSGVMATGVTLIGGKYYFFNAGGAMKTGWQQTDGVWYYFKSGGEAATGWLKLGKVWYYFDGEGRMLTGWQDIGGARYYFKDGGAMATGWLKLDGVYYYLTSGGVMKTGWVKSGKKWYYMEEDGAMLSSCSRVIDGKEYSFDASGACTNP